MSISNQLVESKRVARLTCHSFLWSFWKKLLSMECVMKDSSPPVFTRRPGKRRPFLSSFSCLKVASFKAQVVKSSRMRRRNRPIKFQCANGNAVTGHLP